MLHRLGTAMVVLAVCLCAVGCGSEKDKIKAETEDVSDDFADVLEGIKAKSDVDSARPKLEKIGARIKDVAERAKKLPEADRKALETETQTATAKNKERVDKEMTRISQTLGFETMIGIVEALKIAPGDKPF